jgi:Bacterial DNA-binding protein
MLRIQRVTETARIKAEERADGPQAEEVVNVVFDTITEALRKGETVSLPFGTFEVFDHSRPPLRGWLLNRVRVTLQEETELHPVHPERG